MWLVAVQVFLPLPALALALALALTPNPNPSPNPNPNSNPDPSPNPNPHQVFLLLLKLAYAVLRNKPDQVKSLSTGLDLMIGMAILGALFPMHWNAEHGIVMIMYVPGWAILWSLLWMVSTSAACLTFAYQAMRPHNRAQHLNRETLFLGCVATGSCCYWMWCLYVPVRVRIRP